MNTNTPPSLMDKPAHCSALHAHIDRLLIAALVVCAAALTLQTAAATTYYFDNDSSTPGFGTAGGTWAAPTPGPIPGWSTSATGGAIPGSVTTTTSDPLNFGNGATGLGAGTITLSGALSSSNITFAAGSGAIVLSGGTSLTLPANATITVDNSSDTIATPLAGAGTGLTKVGTGALILSGVNTVSGAVTVNAGELQLNGGSFNLGAKALNVATSTGQVAVVNFVNGSLTNSTSDPIGSGTNNAIGIIKMSGGNYVKTAGNLNFSGGVAGRTNYSAFLQSGGYVSVGGEFDMARDSIGAATYVNLSGGTLVCSNYCTVGREGFGVLDISGGTFFRPSTAANKFYMGRTAGQFAQLTIRGAGTMNFDDTGFYFANSATPVLSGVVNLLSGGTLISRVGINWNANASSMGQFNFNGGTLQASGSSATYWNGLWTACYIYSGGAIIDSQGNNITIAQPLLAPVGSGVTSITGGTGSGYLAPPIVSITGDGTGATAVAQTDSSGNVTNVLITNPGVNYSTATVTLIGGGGTASGWTVNLGANATTGGLTKLGSGTLTLTGANTYQGATKIGAGTLAIAYANYPNASALILSNGAALNLDVSGGSSTLATPTVALNTNTTLNLAYGTLPSGNPTAPAISTSGALNAIGTNIVINITGMGFTVGQFPLITYSGSIGGNGFGAFQLNTLPTGLNASLSNNIANSSIDLVVSSSSQVVWKGFVNGQWDTSTVNWANASSGTHLAFSNSLAALLDDTVSGPGGTSLTLIGALQPASVLFNNSSLNYSLGGAGSLGGAMSLTMSGTGKATITTTNTYTGGTIINAGTVQLGDGATSSGYVAGVINVHGTGTLVLANPGAQTNSYSITNSGAVDVAGSGAQTITGTVSGSGALVVDGTASGSAKLTGTNSYIGRTDVTNNGTLTLADYRTNSTGILHVYSGTMYIQSGDFICGGIENGYGSTGNDGNATVNHSTGSVSFTSATFELVMGVGASSGLTETYNLSGGSLVGFVSTNHGVILGQASCNPGNPSTATFNLSGSGFLNMSNSILALGRADVQANNWIAKFNQTGGTAAIGYLNMGGVGALGSQNINATLNLTGGTMVISNFTSLSAAAGNVSSINIGGTANVTLPAFPTVGSGSATITFDGGTLSPYAASTAYLQGLNNAYLTANGANFNVASGKDITVAQLLQDAPSQSGVLKKTGSGTLTLIGANTYSGITTVSNGTLVVNEAFAANGNVIVADGASLDCLSDTPGATVSLAAATLGASTGAKLVAQFSGNTGNPTTPAGYITNLTLNGSTTVSLLCNGIQVGTIPLFKYSTISGSGSITTGPLPQGVVGTVTNNTTTKTISLIISSFNPLVWSGANGSSWDINVSTNWILNVTPTTYQDGAIYCLFDDTAVNGNIVITQEVNPGSVVFSNNTVAYSVGTSGTGALSGSTGLTKFGTNTVVLSGINTFTGPTVINAGTLQLGAGGTSGSLQSGTVNIGASGTLRFNRSNTTSLANNLTGNGNIVQAGAGGVFLNGVNTFSGAIDVQSGQFVLNGVDSENGAPSVNVASGASLTVGTNFLNGTAATIGNLTGAGQVDPQYNPAFPGTRTLSVNQTSDGIFSGLLTDATSSRVLALTKIGAAKLTLNGTNTYSGATTVIQGALIVNGAVSNSTVTVNSGAAFGGSGTVAGTVSFSGGTIATNIVGAPLTVGTLDMAGNATMKVATAAPLTAGNYPLINYTSLTGSGQFTNFVVGGSGLAGGAAASVVFTNSTVALIVVSGAPAATNISYTVNGSQLVLNWPAGQGWKLQSQTNSLSTGLTTNWTTVSGATPPFTNTITPANSSVFYRLKY